MATKGGVGSWRMPKGGYSRKSLNPLPTTDPYHKQRIRWAVIAIQRDLIRQGYLLGVDYDDLVGGWWDKTERAVRDFQEDKDLFVDGVFGFKSANVLFADWFDFWQIHLSIPDDLVYGICRLESVLDPGAEGWVDNRDRGIAQYNRRWHPEISDEVAFSRPDLCIQQLAIDLHAAYLRHQSEPYGSWRTAVASHNNPAKALTWARTGEAPDNQIKEYVLFVYYNVGLRP